MIRQWCRQILAVIRLEMSKTFLSRRGLWVYLLAFAPVLFYAGHSLNAPRERARRANLAKLHPISPRVIRSVTVGASRDQVVEKLGQPYNKHARRHRVEGGRFVDREFLWYTDGQTDFMFRFVDGRLTDIHRDDPDSILRSSLAFATIFQLYCLRLSIVFGCAGIFMNLFRGEMLDKSLHFYLLSPIRRPLLLVGKYLAGLIATTIIFTASTALQFWAMLWQFNHETVHAYLAGAGWGHLTAYLGVTALACVGYGSIFLAAGLLFRNPIIPAAVVLLWESANLFLPATLKQASLIFYLQSLCPVLALPEADMPVALRLLISVAHPPTTVGAVSGIVILTLLVMLAAAYRTRRLEINYGSE